MIIFSSWMDRFLFLNEYVIILVYFSEEYGNYVKNSLLAPNLHKKAIQWHKKGFSC